MSLIHNQIDYAALSIIRVKIALPKILYNIGPSKKDPKEVRGYQLIAPSQPVCKRHPDRTRLFYEVVINHHTNKKHLSDEREEEINQEKV